MGFEKRKVLWKEVVEERDTFRDAFNVSLKSVAPKLTFPEAVAVLRKGESIDLSSCVLPCAVTSTGRFKVRQTEGTEGGRERG